MVDCLVKASNIKPADDNDTIVADGEGASRESVNTEGIRKQWN